MFLELVCSCPIRQMAFVQIDENNVLGDKKTETLERTL
jgi:hypothetical protein